MSRPAARCGRGDDTSRVRANGLEVHQVPREALPCTSTRACWRRNYYFYKTSLGS